MAEATKRIRPGVRVRVTDADGTRWEGVVIPHVRQVPGCRAQVIPHKPGTQWGVRTVDEHGPCVRFARACEMEVVDG